MPNRVPTYRPKHLPSRPERQRFYDATKRNKESKDFYHTAAWLKARAIKLNLNPLCELCFQEKRLVAATVVHHKIEIAVDPYLRLDTNNMQSLCSACHNRVHA
jgi:5-methylcytosine-specific restriction enzyme A